MSGGTYVAEVVEPDGVRFLVRVQVPACRTWDLERETAELVQMGVARLRTQVDQSREAAKKRAADDAAEDAAEYATFAEAVAGGRERHVCPATYAGRSDDGTVRALECFLDPGHDGYHRVSRDGIAWSATIDPWAAPLPDVPF